MRDVFVYARLFYPYGESSASKLQKVMKKTAEHWTKMFLNSATLFLAGSTELVIKLLDQKAALEQELKQLQECGCTDEDFPRSHDEFVQQLKTGLDESPYYLDVVMRRLLLRVFAVGWLHEDLLRSVFTLELDAKTLIVDFQSGLGKLNVPR